MIFRGSYPTSMVRRGLAVPRHGINGTAGRIGYAPSTALAFHASSIQNVDDKKLSQAAKPRQGLTEVGSQLKTDASNSISISTFAGHTRALQRLGVPLTAAVQVAKCCEGATMPPDRKAGKRLYDYYVTQHHFNPLAFTVIGLTLRERGFNYHGQWFITMNASMGEKVAVLHTSWWALKAGRVRPSNNVISVNLKNLANTKQDWRATVLQGLTLLERGNKDEGFGMLKAVFHDTEATPNHLDQEDPLTGLSHKFLMPPIDSPWKAFLQAAQQYESSEDALAAANIGAFDFDDPEAFRYLADDHTAQRYSATWRQYKSKAAQAGDPDGAMDLAEYYLVSSGIYPLPLGRGRISARQKNQRAKGIEWLRIATFGELSPVKKAKRSLFLAALMREEGEWKEGTAVLHRAAQDLRDASDGKAEHGGGMENIQTMFDTWASSDADLAELVLRFHPSRRLSEPATEEIIE